jgi:hypothetical protein
VRSAVEICLGTNLSQAPKSRPLEDVASACRSHHGARMIGPMPGLFRRRVSTVIGNGVTSLQFNKINGLEGPNDAAGDHLSIGIHSRRQIQSITGDDEGS